MKKSWIIFFLIVVIVAQWAFMSSFQSAVTVSHVSGKRAALVSKLNYFSLRATLQIIPRYNPDGDPVLVTFSNGSQMEITDRYEMQVFLPKSGSLSDDFYFNKILSLTPLSEGGFSQMTLSRERPFDLDVVPDVSDDFLSWYYDEPVHPDLDISDETDVYWLIVDGDATISISGYGAPL